MEVQEKQVNKPILSIGMPVYNGAKYISQALKSLQKQSFQNWKLLIADNASTDNTHEVVSGFLSDERISHIRHSENKGAIFNFEFVLAQADTDYFMWAAADDEWEDEFLETCIIPLQLNDSVGLSFCNIESIDSKGHIIKRYENLSKIADCNHISLIYKFIFDLEINAKANLIYGIFRRQICLEVMKTRVFNKCWGADMAFVLGIIARAQIAINNQILFRKRASHHSLLHLTIWSSEEYEGYFNNMLEATKDTLYFQMIEKLLITRTQLLQSQFKIAEKHKIATLFSKIIYYILNRISKL